MMKNPLNLLRCQKAWADQFTAPLESRELAGIANISICDLRFSFLDSSAHSRCVLETFFLTAHRVGGKKSQNPARCWAVDWVESHCQTRYIDEASENKFIY